jgi:hypothetical protein
VFRWYASPHSPAILTYHNKENQSKLFSSIVSFHTDTVENTQDGSGLGLYSKSLILIPISCLTLPPSLPLSLSLSISLCLSLCLSLSLPPFLPISLSLSLSLFLSLSPSLLFQFLRPLSENTEAPSVCSLLVFLVQEVSFMSTFPSPIALKQRILKTFVSFNLHLRLRLLLPPLIMIQRK